MSLNKIGFIGILVQLLVIIIIIIISQLFLDNTDPNSKSNTNMASNFVKLDSKLLSVGIIGYTGESGRALTKEILKNNIFKSTTLIGRRNVDFIEDFYKNGTQIIVDFDNLDKHDDVFKQDVIYCCLGTTRGASGVEGFKKVDFTYIVESAKMAKKNGCKQFHLVSSAGADKNSYFLYPKTKGEAEDAISKLDLAKAVFYRPKMLLTDRKESRMLEKVFLTLTRPIQYLSPQLMSTPIETLAKSMIANTIYSNPSQNQNVEILDNAKIFELAKLYDTSFSQENNQSN